jgi:hypothetical protein
VNCLRRTDDYVKAFRILINNRKIVAIEAHRNSMSGGSIGPKSGNPFSKSETLPESEVQQLDLRELVTGCEKVLGLDRHMARVPMAENPGSLLAVTRGDPVQERSFEPERTQASRSKQRAPNMSI